MIFKKSFWYAVVLFPWASMLFGVLTTLTLSVMVIIGGCLLTKDLFRNSIPERFSPSPSLDNLLAIEGNALQDFCSHFEMGYSTVHEACQLNINDKMIEYSLHYVVFFDLNNIEINAAPQKEIILVHGVNSGPLFCRNFVKTLVDDGYTVYSVALPGFGQSSIDDAVNFLNNHPSDVLSFYVAFLESFINSKQIIRPVILGHSFGAFVAAKFSITHPSLVGRLILVNSIGFLPTLENSGIYWAMVFKLGFPSRFVRPFGSILNRVFFALNLSNSSKSQYEISLNMLDTVQSSCSLNYGAEVASLFITFNPLRAHWNVDLFENMLNIEVKTDMIWGYYDSIIPSHNAKFVADSLTKIGNPNVCLYMMDGWHSPHDDNIHDFQFLISFVLNDSKMCEQDTVRISQSVREHYYSVCNEYGFSTLCRVETGQNIQKLYTRFHKLFDDCDTEQYSKWYAVKNGRLYELENVDDEDYVYGLYNRLNTFFNEP